MDVLSARIGIGAMSAWFDTLPDPIRGGCAMTLALVYEKKLNETMPFDPSLLDRDDETAGRVAEW